MSLPRVHLRTQLINRLEDEAVSLEERLEVARRVLICSGLPLPAKDELVLGWAASRRGEEAVKALKVCLPLVNLSYLSLTPPTASAILQVLCTHKTEDARLCTEVLVSEKCRWLTRDSKALAPLLRAYYEGGSDPKGASLLVSLVQAIPVSIPELALALIEHYLPLENAPKREVIQRIVLFEPDSVKRMLDYWSMKEECSEDSEVVKELVCFLKKLPGHKTPEAVGSIYQDVLWAVLCKTDSDPTLVLQVLMMLLRWAGVKVHRSNKCVSLKSVSGAWPEDGPVRVACPLLQLLVEEGTRLPEEEGTAFIACLLDASVSLHSRALSTDLLQSVSHGISLAPAVLERLPHALVALLLQPKTPELRVAFSQTLITFLSVATERQRLQKLISRILPLLAEVGRFGGHPSLSLEDTFPQAAADAFLGHVSQLPHSQLLALLKALLFHLETDYLDRLENPDLQFEWETVVGVELVSSLLVQTISGAKMHDYSIPDLVREKFLSMMGDMEQLLHRLALALLASDHSGGVLEGLLKVCVSYGELNHLLRERDGAAHKELSPNDCDPVNLSYVHPYIPQHVWASLALKVQAATQISTKNLFYNLLLQKMKAVSQVEVGEETPGALTARYLLENADHNWLWTHASELARLLETRELVALSQALVSSTRKMGHSCWTGLLNDQLLASSRRWGVALVLALLYKMGRHIEKNTKGRSILAGVTSKIQPRAMVEYETSQELSEAGEARAHADMILRLTSESLEGVLSIHTPSPQHNESLSLNRDIEVIEKIGVQHFGDLNQSLVVIALVALLRDIAPDPVTDTHVFNILLNITEGPGRIDVLGWVDCGEVVPWLWRRGKNDPSVMRLLNNMVSLTIDMSAQVEVKMMIKQIIHKSARSTLPLTGLILRALIKKQNSSVEGGMRPSKLVTQMVELLVEKVWAKLAATPPSPDLLQEFITVYAHASTSLSASVPISMPCLLNEYAVLAMKDISVGSGLVQAWLQHDGIRGEGGPPDEIVSKTWELILVGSTPLPETLVNLLFVETPAQQYSAIMASLDASLNGWDAEGGRGLVRVLEVWNVLVGCSLSGEKERLRQASLLLLVACLLNPKASSPPEPVLNFISNLVSTSSIELRGAVLDYCLVIIDAVIKRKAEEAPSEESVGLVIDIVFELFMVRTALIRDRLPLLTALFRSCANTARLSLAAAFKIEKGAAAMAKKQKDVGRLAPYLLADLLKATARPGQDSLTKNYLRNAIKYLLGVCDTHAVKWLYRVLPPTSQELFKVVLKEFRRHNKYTGKV